MAFLAYIEPLVVFLIFVVSVIELVRGWKQ
jgi:hypothetical protein